jgi:hypothetical protein
LEKRFTGSSPQTIHRKQFTVTKIKSRPSQSKFTANISPQGNSPQGQFTAEAIHRKAIHRKNNPPQTNHRKK